MCHYTLLENKLELIPKWPKVWNMKSNHLISKWSKKYASGTEWFRDVQTELKKKQPKKHWANREAQTEFHSHKL